MKKESATITIALDQDLSQCLRLAALQEKQTLESYIEKAIILYIEEQPEGNKKEAPKETSS